MKRLLMIGSILGAALLAGCGGGTTGTALTGAGRASILLTDSPREDYAHIWATIYHVEILAQSGAPVVLFDDAAGKLIDLRTLFDAAGQRFSFLGSSALPAGTYTGINVSVGATMQLFKNGIASGDPIPVSSTLAKDASGHPVAALTFKSPKTVNASSTTNLVIDFKLAKFVVSASGVLPVVEEGTETGIADLHQHNQDGYHGVVSGLTGTAPVLRFTLTTQSGTTINVATSASTALFGMGTLVNGGNVEADGALDAATNNLVATQLEVQPSQAARGPHAEGAATALDATAGTFTLAVGRAEGLIPAKTTVSVVTTAATLYYGDNGATQTKAEFFAALAATPVARVAGTFDVASNAFTAARLKVDNHAKDGGPEHGDHPFRDGTDRNNWDHGHFHH